MPVQPACLVRSCIILLSCCRQAQEVLRAVRTSTELKITSRQGLVGSWSKPSTPSDLLLQVFSHFSAPERNASATFSLRFLEDMHWKQAAALFDQAQPPLCRRLNCLYSHMLRHAACLSDAHIQCTLENASTVPGDCKWQSLAGRHRHLAPLGCVCADVCSCLLAPSPCMQPALQCCLNSRFLQADIVISPHGAQTSQALFLPLHSQFVHLDNSPSHAQLTAWVIDVRSPSAAHRLDLWASSMWRLTTVLELPLVHIVGVPSCVSQPCLRLA